MTPTPPVLLAHGLGGRQDLPLDFSYVLVGATLALLLSFGALVLLWSRPRLDAAAEGRLLPAGLARILDSPAFSWGLRVLGLVVCGWFLAAGLFGRDVDENPFPGAVFVLLWVGIVPLSVLFGAVWRAVNPLRTLHALLALVLRTPAELGMVRLPAAVGRWPAAVTLFGFVWLELAVPDHATGPVLRTWIAAYAGIMLVGAAVFGSSWFDAADPFEAWSGMFGRLSPLGRRRDGRLVLRSPLAGATTFDVGPGSLAVVAVALGSTAWDSWSGSTQWIGYVQQISHRTAVTTLALLGAVVVVGGAFWVVMRLSGGALASGSSSGEVPVRAAQLPGVFAHTLVPIGLGYVVAHYYSYLVYQGQRTVILATDPLQRGSDYLGLRNASVSVALIDRRTVAVVQVCAVVLGHVAGVVLAHDRALKVFDRRRVLWGQLPLLLLMVGYTVGGLLLLFHG